MANFRSRAARNKTKKIRIMHVVPSYRQLLFGGRIFAVHDVSLQSIFVECIGRRTLARALDADLAGSYENLSVEVVG